MQDYGVETTTYSGNPLFAGHQPISVPGILAAGDLDRGTVLAIVTDTGKWKILAPAANDGTQTAAGILVDDTDASSAEERCNIYVHGEFNDAGMTWPTGITDVQKAAAIVSLAGKGIHVQEDVTDLSEETTTTTTTTTATDSTTSTTTSH